MEPYLGLKFPSISEMKKKADRICSELIQASETAVNANRVIKKTTNTASSHLKHDKIHLMLLKRRINYLISRKKGIASRENTNIFRLLSSYQSKNDNDAMVLENDKHSDIFRNYMTLTSVPSPLLARTKGNNEDLDSCYKRPNVVLVKLVPGLSRTIEEAIEFWEVGFPERGYVALRLFKDENIEENTFRTTQISFGLKVAKKCV